MKVFFFLALLVILAGSGEPSIWETGEGPSTWYKQRLQFAERVPPSRVTAWKLQRFFIDDDSDDPSRRRLVRRSSDDTLAQQSKSTRRRRSTRGLLYDDSGHPSRRRLVRRSSDDTPAQQSESTRTRRAPLYDVIFVVDGSGSIKKEGFQIGLKGLQILISRAKPTTKYATVTFSEQAHIEFPFKRYKEATERLPKVQFLGYRTNTQDALKKCRDDLFLNKTSGVREHSHKRVLIVTDGRSNVDKEFTLYQAYELKRVGVEVFVVAVGKYIDGIEEIIGMASSMERHLYRVESLAGFARVVQLIPPWPYRWRIRGS